MNQWKDKKRMTDGPSSTPITHGASVPEVFGVALARVMVRVVGGAYEENAVYLSTRRHGG